MAIFRAGDKVSVNCSPESDVLARIKRSFAGRVGVVVAAWSPDEGLPINYRNCTVRFPAIGKQREQEIEINFDNLLSRESQ